MQTLIAELDSMRTATIADHERAMFTLEAIATRAAENDAALKARLDALLVEAVERRAGLAQVLAGFAAAIGASPRGLLAVSGPRLAPPTHEPAQPALAPSGRAVPPLESRTAPPARRLADDGTEPVLASDLDAWQQDSPELLPRVLRAGR